jgi:aldehyde dehydrogenase (NAD+)
VNELVRTQRHYFNSNATKPLAFRLAQLNRLKDVLTANEGALQEAIHRDFGKGIFETFLTELYFVHDELNAAIRGVQKWMQPRPMTTDALNAPARSYVLPEPLGVGLVIAPWSLPYQLSLRPAVAAIAAGCTVVLKPSELTAHCSRLLSNLISENFDLEYFAVVEGGAAETAAMLGEKFDVVFFTGSAAVGREVYEAAARHLTPVILELGGKSPAIVAADANLEVAAKRLVWAKFVNAGQSCIAPDYVCVQNSVERAFLDAVAREIVRADYRLTNGNYVNMITGAHAARVSRLIDQDKVYLGGSYDVKQRFIEPTVLTQIRWDDPVMHEEIFGPLLPVIAYDDLNDVIGRIKDRPKPLALYLFTEDAYIRERILREVSFGGGCVNDALMHIANAELPFGGVGESGIGNYHGESGFRTFSHFKSILEKPVSPEADVKYSPHTDEKLEVLKSLVSA